MKEWACFHQPGYSSNTEGVGLVRFYGGEYAFTHRICLVFKAQRRSPEELWDSAPEVFGICFVILNLILYFPGLLPL